MAETIYHDKGYPTRRGVYRCKVDGKEMWLSHRTCDLTGRHWWATVDGHDVVGCKVEWSDEMLKVE